MGEVIDLTEWRVRRRTGRFTPTRVRFAFDLACPFSYLAAERVERAFARIAWIPACGSVLRAAGGIEPGGERARLAAERRAAELRLPLIWPERDDGDARLAMRVAAYAAEQGRAAAFVLAAARLAYCGGYDLEDPETLAEAAAAAGIGLDECLLAARDRSRDAGLDANALALGRAGADRLPVLQVGRALYMGEARVVEAVAAARAARPSVAAY